MSSSSSENWGWETFFEVVAAFLERSSRELNTASESYSDYVVEGLEHCLRSLDYIQDILSTPHISFSTLEMAIVDDYGAAIHDLIDVLCSLLHQWRFHIDSLQTTDARADSYHAPIVRISRRGRPRFDIGRDQIIYLESLNFTWSSISSMMGVSRMTIYRRRQELNLLGNTVGGISDAELILILREFRWNYPATGEVMAIGHLRSLGYRVNRDRVRRTLRAIDPISSALRGPRGITARRPYSVPGPNSLWHIDGHHKLIRWRLVTHGGIDGYTRMVVYLRCSSNNRAATVYSSFLEAVQQCGLPSRVRSDQGGENVSVAQHMLEHRGDGRGSIITGASTHNQRIERFWRDMHRCITKVYYRLFYHLENVGLLDPVHEVHLFALHYMYLPRINESLLEFKRGWNHHSIRTEHNRSPYQLFVEGSLSLQRSGLVALDFFDHVDTDYGIDSEGLHAIEEDVNRVTVPDLQFQLRAEDLEQLTELVDPIADSSDYGISEYESVLQFIHRVVSANPTFYQQWIP